MHLINRLEVTEKAIFGTIQSDMTILESQNDLITIAQELQKREKDIQKELIKIWKYLEIVQIEIVFLDKALH